MLLKNSQVFHTEGGKVEEWQGLLRSLGQVEGLDRQGMGKPKQKLCEFAWPFQPAMELNHGQMQRGVRRD